MYFTKKIVDPILLDGTVALLGEALNAEKRWGGVPYMPEHYADTVKEHVDTTVKTFTQVLSRYPQTPYTQEMLAVGTYAIQVHDGPEAFGELLLGGQEQDLASGTFDQYPIDLKSFSYAYCHAEHAVINGTHAEFLHNAAHVKRNVKNEKAKKVTEGHDPNCIDLLEYMFQYQGALLHTMPAVRTDGKSNLSFAQDCFALIENEHIRKTSFVGSVAKALEKNDSGTHMARIYQTMLKTVGAEQVSYRYNQNNDLLKSLYREAAPLADVLLPFAVNASDRGVQENIARDTVRFVYGTCQDYFKFAPEYIDLENRDIKKQPNATSGRVEHEAYRRDLKERYDAQDPQNPETHGVISKQDLMLRLETNKQTLCVIQTKDRLCIQPSADNHVYWKHYADLKRDNWILHTPY